MVAADIPSIAHLHELGFPGLFLTSLGYAFLCELYSAILTDISSFAFVAVCEANNCRFVAGTTQLSGFYGRLIRRRAWRFAFAAMPVITQRPSISLYLLRAFLPPRQVTHRNRCGTLMPLAMHPDKPRNGIDTSLVRVFLQEASMKGLEFVELATNQLNNKGANRFYQEIGFMCERSYLTSRRRLMNKYVFDLSILSSTPD